MEEAKAEHCYLLLLLFFEVSYR